MIKKLILTAIFTTMLVMPITVWGAGFSFSDKISISDSVGYAVNNKGATNNGSGGVAGVFIGTLGEYRTESDKKMLGFLGFTIQGASAVGDSTADREVRYTMSACPVTFFNDMIQTCYGYNFTDGTGMASVGVSLSKATSFVPGLGD